MLWLATKFVQNLLAMVGVGGGGGHVDDNNVVVVGDPGSAALLVSEAASSGGVPGQLGGDILLPPDDDGDVRDHAADAIIGEIATSSVNAGGVVAPAGGSNDETATFEGNELPQEVEKRAGIKNAEEETVRDDEDAALCVKDGACPSNEAVYAID